MRPTGEARQKRVLVVEDHVDLALGLGTVLHMLGHCVETAFDGSSAIEKVRVFRPHAVVCDLPKMDGFEVARILRVDPRLGSVRLIALSAQDRVDDASPPVVITPSESPRTSGSWRACWGESGQTAFAGVSWMSARGWPRGLPHRPPRSSLCPLGWPRPRHEAVGQVLVYGPGLADASPLHIRKLRQSTML